MTTAKTTELKLRTPAEFNGDRSKTNEFLLDCKMYLQINEKIYDTHDKKILFIMSYMRGGTAGPWKEDYFNSTMKDNNGDFGEYATFLKAVAEAFSPSDAAGDARSKLKTLQMKGGMTADEYVAEFRTAASHSGIKEDAALIEYFMEGIPGKLMEKIAMMEDPPATLEGWQKCASKLDNNYRRAKAISARIRGDKPKDKKKWQYNRNTPARYTPHSDPNAMDVDRINLDRLSVQDREEHMKKGLCFECHKSGHRASDHRAGGSNDRTNINSTWRKTPMKGKETYQKIRGMLAELDDEEKEIALKNMEEEGF